MDGEKVRYGFSPGPFMQALAEAYREPTEPAFLVIEELNRAAAAAVFGDLFLLLDRDEDGMGEYDVSFPSPESEQWFEEQTKAAHVSLLLPPNLYIYATMNSADQGVYPIDTAFRRRWRQEYLRLEYEKDKASDGDVAYVDAKRKHHSLEWREFVKLLNGQVTGSRTLDIAEDRLLGQWFVKTKELDGKSIPNKVLLYLLRHVGRELIFDKSSIPTMTYGELALRVENGERILSDDFLATLNAASGVHTAEPEETTDDAD